jgi:RimJ/RimL family protein N-acetyltransferase
MIGMTGFNSFPKEGELGDTSTQVLVGDTGAMIDYRYARRGYALEAMEAVFEYGFGVLGCGIMSLDTDKENEPWRALMRSMGLGDVEVVRRIEEGNRTGEDEVSYRFDRAKWEICKRGLEERGKWLL